MCHSAALRHLRCSRLPVKALVAPMECALPDPPGDRIHPDTGSFEGHHAPNPSEHYLHSRFDNLMVSGLVMLEPRAMMTKAAGDLLKVKRWKCLWMRPGKSSLT